MRSIDLHTHTFCSDGTLSPHALLTHAAEQGVEVLALTDHDTTEGLAEAGQAANELGVTLIPGVEISATWGARTIHVVGLNINPDHGALQTGLAALRVTRSQRAIEISERLAKQGIDHALAGAQGLARGSIVSRTHFARHLVEAGHVRDIQQAFKKFLAHGGPGFARVQWAGLDQAVRWIVDAGGAAVIAHPGRYKLGTGKLKTLLAEFAGCGGHAIEVISGSQHPQETPRFARLAREFDLAVSLGSDYHGPEQHWLQLGRLPALPEGSRPVWEHWLPHE